MVNRSNPYVTPPTVDGDPPNALGVTQRSLLKLIAIPLVGLTCWSIYFVSPLGIILPAVIAWAFATYFAARTQTAILSAVLAYVVGVSAIICADGITNAYDPLLLNDDVLRPIVTRIYAASGILGALVGAASTVFFAAPKRAQSRAEP